MRTLELDVDGWGGHRAGQHLDVRLTSEDGYQAERSYSIASAPGERLAITVEVLENGEVSPYLVEDVHDGDRFEVRGLRLLDEDEPGFWEQNGYNIYGDPWKEQRYWGD